MAKFRTSLIAPSTVWATVQMMSAATAAMVGESHSMGGGRPLATAGAPEVETHRGSHFHIGQDLSALAADVPKSVAGINAKNADVEGWVDITEADLNGFLAAVDIDNTPLEGESDKAHFGRRVKALGLVDWEDPDAISP